MALIITCPLPIPDFDNENDETMNEYKGFKVGDKVEIRKYMANWSSALGGSSPANAEYPLIGNIRNIGGSGIGQFGHVAVNIEGYGFNLDNLIITDNIKKLPKFSVGDKVRRHNLMAKLCTITKVFPDCSYTVNDCGDLQFKESDLVPFDGYRTGDEVWTLKRGKGIYCGECGGANSGRAWVRYNGVDWHPKLSNLLTEAEYKAEKAALNRIADDVLKMTCKEAFKAWGDAAKTLREFGEITRKINELKLPSGGVVAPKPQPKFKVGDVVYYDGGKFTVKEIYNSNCFPFDYHIESEHTCRNVKESDLRLWKETKLTHCLQQGSDKWYEWCYKQKYDEIKFIGKINGHDTFVVKEGNTLCLFRGIKGDDL